jgi:cytoskeletal protein CcmA (bactofilin family)
MKFKTKLKMSSMAGLFNGFNPDKFDSLIGQGTSVKGVDFVGTIRIDGEVIGNVVPFGNPKGPITVVVGKTGWVAGNVVCADFVVVAGRIRGKVVARKQLVVRNGGSIEGDVEYADIAMESGGTILGNLTKFQPQEDVVKTTQPGMILEPQPAA